mgnify:CR=1 FL=1
MAQSVFITATGTDVGKTYVTALMVKKLRGQGLNAGYYKAALSGAELVNDRLVPGDAKYVRDTAGLACDPADLVSYIYATPVAPHLAAQREGNPLELEVVRRDFTQSTQKYDYVVMEGAGGLVCPLRCDETAEIMQTVIITMLGLPVLLVADAGFGAINGCVLSVEFAKKHAIIVTGIILNRYENNNFLHADNKRQIERLTKVPVMACVGANAHDLDIDAQLLTGLFKEV